MKNSSSIGKGQVIKLVTEMGTSIERVSSREGRVWITPEGRTFPTLEKVYQFFSALKRQKEKSK